VVERLKTLYTLAHLRDRLHVTLRDLRSALAFTLTGGRDCEELHELYRVGDTARIAGGFYFNAWMGGTEPARDRLLTLLKEIDIGAGDDPQLDRRLDYAGPDPDAALLTFEQRGGYDRRLLAHLFDELPRGWTGEDARGRALDHRSYVAMARRRFFFECRDERRWRELLPYRSAARLLDLIAQPGAVDLARDELLAAINRGEGITGATGLGGAMALQVRTVEGGTIRSYRLFPRDRFLLAVLDPAAAARFVEHTPTGLVLRYHGPDGAAAELWITLDVFEMLHRLNQGYRPTPEEQQGYYLSLTVFKHVLAAVPYQEVLLTTTGQEFHRIERTGDGRLRLHRLDGEEMADAVAHR